MSADTSHWLGMEISGGRYRVTELLGEGGMGQVFRAWDANLGTDVVIKIPRRSALLDDPEFAARFALEIRSLVKLAHPHIVKVTDVGEHDGLPYCVMQYLQGGSLEDFRQGEDGHCQPQPPANLTTWLPGIAQALDFVHDQGYIHRDVKPGNILFDAHGNVYLSDFGIAKVHAESSASHKEASLTGAGMVLGTPEYMAPELIMGRQFDGRIDQYALAVTVYEYLAGRPPFTGAPSALLVLHTTEQAPLPSQFSQLITPAVEDCVLQGMAKSPEDRYADCQSFANDLLAALKDGGGVRKTMKVSRPTAKIASLDSDTAPARVTAPMPQLSARPALGKQLAEFVERRKAAVLWSASTAAVLLLAGSAFFTGKTVADVTPQTIVLTEADQTAAIPAVTIDESASFVNSLGMRLVCIRPGKFATTSAETGNILPKPIWVAEHEVVLAQYLIFLEELKQSANSHFPTWFSDDADQQDYTDLGDDLRLNRAPIVGITRADAEAFCLWLTAQEKSGFQYRLPTNNEWECAYRAGTSTKYWWGDEPDGQKCPIPGRSDATPAFGTVGRFPANAWGLFDMAGSVWELTSDSATAAGGSWNSTQAEELSAAGRRQISGAGNDIGFRVVAERASVPAAQ